MAKAATSQVSAPIQHFGDGNLQESQTVPRGWTNFLTWRKSKPTTIKFEATPPQAPRHQYSPASGRQQLSNRSRAPIPFDIAPRRTASSSSTASINDLFRDGEGSTSVMEVENDLATAMEDDDDLVALDSAFASLSRVRKKSDSAQGSLRGNRSPAASHLRTSQLASPVSPSSESLASGSWLSTIRSTLPRGVMGSLFTSESIAQPDSNEYPSSPTSFTTIPSSLGFEKWKAAETDDIDRFVDQVLGFAGVDGKSRSVVTLSAPNLPPVDQASHDAILQRILIRTQPLVENAESGYTLILFASGADLIDGSQDSKTAWPGWTWCWRAWRSLGRSYRKNLKRLYIVHPTFFTKNLVRFISTGSYFVSPKFAKKIVQCNSLVELNKEVPLNQLEIPPEVLIWDLKMGAKEGGTEGSNDEDDNTILPTMVRDCIDILKGNHNTRSLLGVEGIFRIPPSNGLLRAASYAYRLNQRPNLARFARKDVHLPAALLKSALRSLPLPLFPASTYSAIERCPRTSEEEMLQYIRNVLLPILDARKVILLSYILQCLHEVSQRSDQNRMDSGNLATVMTPNLVRSEDAIKDVTMCRVQKVTGEDERDFANDGRDDHTTLGTIIALCIERYYEVFDEIEVDLPVLNFETDYDERRNSLGTLTSSSRNYIGQRNFPGSPPRRSNNRNGTGTSSSPTTTTLNTKRSSGSLRVKNRLLSGGSLRGDKGNQSLALVGTSAAGEFERRTPRAIDLLQSSSFEVDDKEDEEAEENLLDLQSSPSIRARKARPTSAEGLGIRHDRRPLSEVFEE